MPFVDITSHSYMPRAYYALAICILILIIKTQVCINIFHVEKPKLYNRTKTPIIEKSVLFVESHLWLSKYTSGPQGLTYSIF